MEVTARSLKRMKRQVTVDLYDFLSFSAATGEKIIVGPFRTDVRTFLTHHALLPQSSSLFSHLVMWRVLFCARDLTGSPESVSPALVYLDIIEEEVVRSRFIYCD